MARGEAGHGAPHACICLGGTLGEESQANDPARAKRLPQHPGWGLAGNAGDARLGGEPRPLAGSHCPVPAHPLRMPQEGGGRPSPGAALRSLGVSLAEAPATRPEAPPAPPERGTRGSSPAATGVLGMTSRYGHSPAEGGCCRLGSIRQLCQDLCWGAEAQCGPQQGGSLRAARHCTPVPALRVCRRLLREALGCALPRPGVKGRPHPASGRSCVGMPQTRGLKSPLVGGDMGPWAGTAPGRGALAESSRRQAGQCEGKALGPRTGRAGQVSALSPPPQPRAWG